MTEGHRCPHCDDLLDSASLELGECGCRWRPRKHDFDPDPGSASGDCLECGYPFAFGALHHEAAVPEVVDLEPMLCDYCGHEPHEPKACRYGKRIYRRDWMRCSCAASSASAA
jgi:hypothetical protein